MYIYALQHKETWKIATTGADYSKTQLPDIFESVVSEVLPFFRRLITSNSPARRKSRKIGPAWILATRLQRQRDPQTIVESVPTFPRLAACGQIVCRSSAAKTGCPAAAAAAEKRGLKIKNCWSSCRIAIIATNTASRKSSAGWRRMGLRKRIWYCRYRNGCCFVRFEVREWNIFWQFFNLKHIVPIKNVQGNLLLWIWKSLWESLYGFPNGSHGGFPYLRSPSQHSFSSEVM